MTARDEVLAKFHTWSAPLNVSNAENSDIFSSNRTPPPSLKVAPTVIIDAFMKIHPELSSHRHIVQEQLKKHEYQIHKERWERLFAR